MKLSRFKTISNIKKMNYLARLFTLNFNYLLIYNWLIGWFLCITNIGTLPITGDVDKREPVRTYTYSILQKFLNSIYTTVFD